ncbi:MAG: response regulator [Verrucomicrobiae bacterium]|nr:response regulator [Verrucomicrobiae bacterium]
MRGAKELPTVLDCLPDAIWLLDPAGGVRFANAAARALAGDGGGDGAPDAAGALGACLERLRRDGTVPAEPFAIRCSGATRWYAAQATRCECGGGPVLVWREVTASKDAEDRLSLFRRALSDCSNAVCIADCTQKDMPLVFVNSSFEVLTGYKPTEAIGRNCRFLQGDERNQEAVDEIRKALGDGRSCRVVLKNFRKDGSMFWNELFLSPIRDDAGRITHFLGFQNDVTQLREAELALIKARDAAESADRAKDEFLAVMSHEIRTPMQSVFGFTDLLLRTTLDDEQRRFVTVIRSQSDALLAILNDILDFSRLRSGAMELESIPFGIRDVVDDVMATVRGSAEAKGLEVDVQMDGDLPAMVVGDAARLRQILMNLLSNAVKFTRRGKVVVRASARHGVGDGRHHVGFEVVDTGRGISEEQLPRLFRSFSQLDAADVRRHGGTGLGLAITKKLAELMGGEVGVRSCPGKGSTFWVRLPFEGVPGPAMAVPSRPESGGDPADPGFAARHPMRILVVEDNALAAEVVCGYLSWMGFRPDHATSASAALSMVGRADYGVIIMDLQMPDIDGLETSRIIRAAYGGRHRPQIIALTANAMAGERERCLAAGLDDYLTKPMGVKILRAALLAAEARLSGAAGPGPGVAGEVVSWAQDGAAVLDDSALRQMERLGTGAAARMIGLMRQEAPDHLNDIGAAASAGDAVALGRAAHKFKGGCSVIGARRLARECEAIAEAALRGDMAAADGRVSGLRGEWEALSAELDGLERAMLEAGPAPRA